MRRFCETQLTFLLDRLVYLIPPDRADRTDILGSSGVLDVFWRRGIFLLTLRTPPVLTRAAACSNERPRRSGRHRQAEPVRRQSSPLPESPSERHRCPYRFSPILDAPNSQIGRAHV